VGRGKAVNRRPATINDVAIAAGVSTSTVSRSFTNPELIRHETRVRVLEAARRLEYVPNRQARSLATGTTGNFGLVVPDVMNPFFPPFIKAAQARARDNDRDVFLADSDEDPAVESLLLRRLAQRVDGLLLCSSRVPDSFLLELAHEMPVVLFNRAVDGIASVIFDVGDGMRQAVAHLASLGHQRIGYAGGPAHSWSDKRRREALAKAAHSLGVAIVDLGQHVPTWEAGIQAADAVVAASVSAVVVFDDTMAIGVMSRLRARGVRVPEDISVVGHDNIAMASMYPPSLTTIEVKCAAAGRAATDLLLGMPPRGTPARGSSPAPAPSVLPVQLLIRESTGPASRKAP
jgi:DNA-binding LacI/PurR family transcriptional regulator